MALREDLIKPPVQFGISAGRGTEQRARRAP
jgi:hypothetical protein